MASLIEADARLAVLTVNRREALEIIQKLTAQLAGVGSGACPTVTVNDGLGKKLSMVVDRQAAV